MRKTIGILLALCMVFGLVACGNIPSTTPPSTTPTNITPSTVPPCTVPPTEPAGTMTAEQLETELISIKESLSVELSDLNTKISRLDNGGESSLLAEAERALCELDFTESILLNGFNLPVKLEFMNPQTSTSRIEVHNLLTVSGEDTSFPYIFPSQGEILKRVIFPFDPDITELWVNGTKYFPFEISDESEALPEEIAVKAEGESVFKVVMKIHSLGKQHIRFEVSDTVVPPINTATVPESISRLKQELEYLRSSLTSEQLLRIENLYGDINMLHKELPLREEEFLSKVEPYAELFNYIEQVEYVLIHGLPVRIYINFQEGAWNFMDIRATADSDPQYMFPHPWGATPAGTPIRADKLCFITIPHAKVIFNEMEYSTDSNGIISIPWNGAPIPESIKLSITTAAGKTFSAEISGEGDAFKIFSKYYDPEVFPEYYESLLKYIASVNK